VLSGTDAATTFADAKPEPFWLDSLQRPEPCEPLTTDAACDLAVVGAGFTGLWTALTAKQRDPARDVVLIDAREVGHAATGRNGGFCDASLTHGLGNGLERFAGELHTLERLGLENLDAIESAVQEHAIDCGWERTGTIDIATDKWMVEELREEYDAARHYGHDVAWLDREAVQAQVHSPTYRAGLLRRDRTAMVDPARLAWGLKGACLDTGVRIHENTPATDLHDGALTTPHGRLRAHRVALATSAFPPLVRRARPYVLPIYDYVLVTEPLSAAQREAIGWRGRQGLGDGGNQFHYYRLTEDDRILWGGYDAIYHWRNGLRDELDQRPATFEKLAEHFFATFPQLDGLKFTHKWGGAIDTCSRFSAFWGTAAGGSVAYSLGFTGLGVGASRFGARVMLDLLQGQRTDLTELNMVRTKPVPFPPEPLRSAVVNLTRWSLANADRNDGRRNAWLRTLDRLGLGFDS
jgi:glycine/D-amino acid oxidase-like deaminating enzyme